MREVLALPLDVYKGYDCEWKHLITCRRRWRNLGPAGRFSYIARLVCTLKKWACGDSSAVGDGGFTLAVACGRER